MAADFTATETEMIARAESVVVARAYRGVTFDSSRQAFVLGQEDVAAVQRRQLSRSRTTVAAVAAVLGFAALVGTIVAIADPNPSAEEPLPPPPPSNRAPLTPLGRFSLPLIRLPIP